MSNGDITKRDTVMWSFGPGNSAPFLRYQIRNLLFRESVIAFFSSEEGKKEENLTDTYCKSCKQANPNVDCSKCSRKVEVMKDAKLTDKRTD